jgi:rhodanese-related sulfurtransferase
VKGIKFRLGDNMLNTKQRYSAFGKTAMVPTISRDELKRKIDLKDHFLLVEVLPATSYHHAHLPGAINLPPDQLDKLAPQLLPDKHAEIVVYCASPT